MPPLSAAERLRRTTPPPLLAIFLIPWGLKVEFNELGGLLGSGNKLPIFYGILTRLDEQRMATQHAGTLYVPVRSDDDFNFDLARYVHAAGKVRINRCNLPLNFALGFVGRRRL